VKGEELGNYFELGRLLRNVGCLKNFNEQKTKQLWDTIGPNPSKQTILHALYDILLLPKQIQDKKWNREEIHKDFYELYNTYNSKANDYAKSSGFSTQSEKNGSCIFKIRVIDFSKASCSKFNTTER
jgi:hypothetical protein